MTDRGSRRSVLALAGVCGLCCIGFGSLALGGGAVLSGAAAVGVTATDGAIRSLGGLLVTGLAILLPLLVVAAVLRRRGGSGNGNGSGSGNGSGNGG